MVTLFYLESELLFKESEEIGQFKGKFLKRPHKVAHCVCNGNISKDAGKPLCCVKCIWKFVIEFLLYIN